MPGESNLDSFVTLTERIGDLAFYRLREETGVFSVQAPDGDYEPILDVTYGPLQNNVVEWLHIGFILSTLKADGTYEHAGGDGSPAYREYFAAYSLANILSTYGKPDAVLLGGDALSEPGYPFMYVLSLYYIEKGFYVEYMGGMGGEPNFVICPMRNEDIRLLLWEPVKYHTLEELDASSLPIGLIEGGLNTLEQRTDLTLDQFYETFKLAEEDTCLESPRENWPWPWPLP